MITQETFGQQAKRLIEKFGERPYAGETLKGLYQIIQNSDPDEFKAWVTEQIITKRGAPLATEFREFEYASRKNKFKVISSEISKNLQNLDPDAWKAHTFKCNKCFDSGSLFARNKENKCEYIFVCDCPEGENSIWAENKRGKDWALKIKRWRFMPIDEREQYSIGGQKWK